MGKKRNQGQAKDIRESVKHNDPLIKASKSTLYSFASTAKVYVVYNPKVTSIDRIKREFELANHIFNKCNIRFKLVGLEKRFNLPHAERTDVDRNLPGVLNLPRVKGSLIIVYYLPGETFADGGTVGVTYGGTAYPTYIVITDGASEATLAHEIGHALNQTHRAGVVGDPDPYRYHSNDLAGRSDQPEHNNNIHNLMWPYENRQTHITGSQCRRFRKSNLLRP